MIRSYKYREISRTVCCGHMANFDPALRGYPNIGRSRRGEWGERWINLTGAAGTYASVPSSAALNPAGDAGFRIFFSEALAITTYPLAKEDSSGQRSYRMGWSSSRTPQMILTTDGSTSVVAMATAALSATARGLWGTWRQSDGRVQFFELVSGVWSQVGSDRTIAIASIFQSTSTVNIGAWFGGTQNPYTGAIYRAQVFASLADTSPVLDIRPSDMTSQGSFVCSTGQTVTLNGAAQVVAPGMAMEPINASQRPTRVVERGLHLYKVTGGTASIPNAANLDPADLDMLLEVAFPDWTPTETTEDFMGRGTGSDRSWGVRLNNLGFLYFFYSFDGSSHASVNTTTSLSSFADRSTHWVRITRSAATGVVIIYTSDDYDADADTGTWTQIGNPLATTAGALFDSASTLVIGAMPLSSGHSSGIYKRFVFRDGIGGAAVLDIDFTSPTQFPGQSSGTAATGQTVTINRPASGLKPVLHTGETRATAVYDGTDDRLTVANHALLNMGAGQAFTVGAMVRQFITPNSFGRYIAKRVDTLGYDLETVTGGGMGLFRGYANDGTTIVGTGTGAPTITAGALALLSGRREGSVWNVAIGSSLSANQSAPTGALDTTHPLTIGTRSDGGNPQHAEIPAWFVARSALTAEELSRLQWELANYANPGCTFAG